MKRGAVITVVSITILIWGFAFLPLKRLLNAAYTDHPLSWDGFLVLRFAPLLPVLLWLIARHSRRERRETLARDWPWIVLMGLLIVPGYHVPMNLALKTPLHTGLISLILSLSPAMTYFLAVALGQERAQRARTAGVLLALCGLLLIFGEELSLDGAGGGARHVFSWKGAGLMFLSTLSWTTYTLIGRRLGRDHDPQFVFAASETAGTLAVLAAAPFFLTAGHIQEWRAMDGLDWASWAYVSVLSSFFAYWAWLQGLAHFEASRLASYGNLVPLLAHIAAAVFLPEERRAFTPLYLLGAALTLGGTTLVIRARSR